MSETIDKVNELTTMPTYSENNSKLVKAVADLHKVHAKAAATAEASESEDSDDDAG
jgi:hypothetical protein